MPAKTVKRSDRLVLSALLACKKLSTSEIKAFRSMLESLDSGQIKLTPTQRIWVEEVYLKHQLDKVADREPTILVKSKTAKANEQRTTHPFDEIIANRPLKPPGRA